MTIRTKILGTFLLAFVLTVGVITVLAYEICSVALETMSTSRLQRLAQEFLVVTDLRLQESLNTLQDWAHRSDIPAQIIVGDVDGVVAEALRDLSTHGSFAKALECVDRQGKVIASTVPGTLGLSRAREAWFEASLRGESYQGDLEADRDGTRLVLGIAQPVWSTTDEPQAPKAGTGTPVPVPGRSAAQRRVVGAVFARIDWDTVIRLLSRFEDEERMAGFLTTSLELVDSEGIVRTSRNGHASDRKDLFSRFGPTVRELMKTTQSSRIVTDRQNSQQLLVVLQPARGDGLLASRHWYGAALQSTEEAFALSRSLLFWVSLVGLLTTVALGTIAAVILGRMVAPILRYVGFAEQLGRGEFPTSLPVMGSDDIATLGRSLNQMRESLLARTEELKRRAQDLEFQHRCKSQINQLSNRLQGLQDLRPAARTIIGDLGPQLNAIQGAFYVRESLVESGGASEVLRLVCGYALADGDQAARSIHVGSGLVGQCAAQGRRLLVDQVPPDHFRIESGLGSSLPGHLLLVPVHFKGELFGVLELASFSPFNAALLDYLDQLLPTLGIVLENIAARANTERLLQESRELTEKLREQSETLALSSRYKSEFLANMSHELRTPLNSLLILANLLARNKAGNLSSQQVEYARTIAGAGSDLLNMIDQILDLSKIEAGKMNITAGVMNFEELRRELEKGFRAVAEERNLEFSVTLADGLPSRMITDQLRVQQVLKNLLSNSFKFTHAGTVSVIVKPQPGDKIAITVEDTGIGIPKDKLHLIFEAFQQADGTISRRYGGTGLGLSISKELARLLGGTIQLASEVGNGSAFTLLLPAEWEPPPQPPTLAGGERFPLGLQPYVFPIPPPRIATQSPTPESDRPQPVGKTLLIIEDDQRFTRILTQLGQENGFRVLSAATGGGGLRLALAERPDSIILDVLLPNTEDEVSMSGWDVLERLKASPGTREIPVHVVTILEEVELGMKMGAVEVIKKPVSPERLMSLFSHLGMISPNQSRTVLLLEPAGGKASKVREAIARSDLKVTVVGSVAAAKLDLEKTPPNCLILDLESVESGITEFLQEMSQDPVFRQVPAIVYTGRPLRPDESETIDRLARTLVLQHAASIEKLTTDAAGFLHVVANGRAGSSVSPVSLMSEKRTALAGRIVMVVDDDERNLFALRQILESEQVTVVTARNGKDCLEKLKGGTKVDLILMDTMMPELDGTECTRQVRRMVGYQRVPIIAVTAKAMLGDRQACLDSGANDYLTKPVDAGELLKSVQHWLRVGSRGGRDVVA